MEDQIEEKNTASSSSYNLNENKSLVQQKNDFCSDLSYRLVHPDIPKIPKLSGFGMKNISNEENNCNECIEAFEPYCHVKLDSIIKLKNSTKKLLYLLDEIQSKTHSRFSNENGLNQNHDLRPIDSYNITSVTDSLSARALRKLENQTKYLEEIYVQDDNDDCSVYKRLTRKCHCLNQDEYNDFIIHFNEDTKYTTSNIGEIIKNMKILKKFLYMASNFTKNALTFLNEGLSDCPHTEKVEITQGCAHADICNIFEEHSIVIICISWPCKYEYYGDSVTQSLTAGFLYKLAEIEEGRRYLNFTSKISNDIRKVLRKKSSMLDVETIDSLNATLNLLKPPFAKNSNITYFCKSIYEGFGYKTVNDLLKFRQYMTLEEMLSHLDLLKKFSNGDTGKVELTSHLPAILVLFKNMLMEYDNSGMNIIITHILNNIVCKNMAKPKEKEQAKVVSIADTATEPIKTRNEVSQVPVKKNTNKKMNKLKLTLGVAPNKNRHPSKCQVSGWEPSNLLNRSRKFTKDLRRSIIVVPIENNKTICN